MKKENLIVVIFAIVAGLIFLSPALSQEKRNPSPTDRCGHAKKDYIVTEREGSSMNADAKFLRDEMERLRNLRWKTKGTLCVLEDALEIIKEKGVFTRAQLMTLNSRIPNHRGTIHPDGTFTMTGLEIGPVPIEEVRNRLAPLLAQFDEDIKKMENELREKEQKSYLLSQRLNGLEELIEKECRATGTPTPWEQGIPRDTGKDIYQRYVERERRRQEEVESRRYADMERLWSRGYHYPYSVYPSKALLIELKSVDMGRTCLHCFPFGSPVTRKGLNGALNLVFAPFRDKSLSRQRNLME
jgi:hypothetical protein